MKKNDIFNAFEKLDEKFVVECAPKGAVKRRKTVYFRLVAAIVAVAIMASALLGGYLIYNRMNETDVIDVGETNSIYAVPMNYVLSTAQYKKMLQLPNMDDYENWREFSEVYETWNADRKSVV